MKKLALFLGFIALVCVPSVYAQQRPLVTEDPETIGSGLVLIEGGFDLQKDVFYPASGLQGNLLRIPTLGVSFGVSSIAELQIDGGIYNGLNVKSRREAPLSDLLDFDGDHTHDVEDIVIGTKIRLMAESASRPALGLRFATKLPNASNESGLGLDTTDFNFSALLGKTVRSIRMVGNAGLGILADPVEGNRQNDVFTYGFSIARAVQQGVEVVGEINGRLNTRSGTPPVGTESRGAMRVGARFTRATVRVDAGLIFGMTSRDPSVGLTAGATWVFKGFTVP
ncbi:MAG TPA: hypothetical protein VFT39_19875 [Vicinamibacterales bacterium]|nr:hypothetical protein [Vicinamibacterales bacterium]